MNKMGNSLYRTRAKEKAAFFLEHEKSYQLGFIEAEQSNPLTIGLGEAAVSDPELAVGMINSVDRALSETFKRCTRHSDYQQFLRRIEKILRSSGRIVFSGCGSTGRIAQNLEASWRRALVNLAEEYNEPCLLQLAERVVSVFTGGDYALIKSVENFEDYNELGKEQIRELNLTKGDLLVGITATAETTSIIGMANAAIEAGADVEMIVCSRPDSVCERLERVRNCFSQLGVYSVYFDCGAMAVTGSTRMQSSTIEHLACAAALQEAMRNILHEKGIEIPAVDYAAAFAALTEALSSKSAISILADFAILEADTYAVDGRITYFADEYLIDILTDTTERTPTFMAPPFAPTDSEAAKKCWTYVKNPRLTTPEAWQDCLMHTPRCIEWSLEKYRELDTPVDRVPDIRISDLMRFHIGNEPDILREKHRPGFAIWVDANPSPAYVLKAASVYPSYRSFTLKEMGIVCEATPMRIFEHLALKLALNIVSTVCMGHLGRLTSNFMTWVSLSNKKLLDRSARLIAQECKIPYAEALEELFYTEELHGQLTARDFDSYSPAQSTIARLKML